MTKRKKKEFINVEEEIIITLFRKSLDATKSPKALNHSTEYLWQNPLPFWAFA